MAVIGFIGLGAMGGPMAANLLQACHDLIVYDLDSDRVGLLADRGAKAAGSPGEAAERADVVITSLPGNEELSQVVMGKNGLFSGFSAGGMLIDTTTADPGLTRQLGQALAERGVRMLDAPVARTTEAAAAGTLAIMVGGEEADFHEFLPLIECIGSDIFHCGPLGSGQVVKLLNNLVLFCNVTAAAEALVLGEKVGVDPETVVRVLSVSSGGSFALDNHIRNAVLPRRFPTGRFSVDYALKDLDYALSMGRQNGAPMFHGSVVQQLLKAAGSNGLKERYYPVVSEIVRNMAGLRDHAPYVE